MKRPGSRQVVLALALLTTVLIAFMPKAETASSTDAIAEPVRHESPLSSAKSETEVDPAEKPLAARIARAEVALSESDPFRTKSWYVPPPPPPPPPPEKPRAPPLPFRYMGMYEDQSKVTVYLVRGDESFAVSPGEQFAGSYRLEKIEQGMLIISYLPLAINQTLPSDLSQ